MAGLDPDFVDHFAKQWLDLWNAHDLPGVRTLCTDDVIMDDPATPEPARGWAEAEQMNQTLFVVFPDFHVDWIRVYACTTDPELMMQWQFSATMQGPLDPPGFAPTNTAVALEGATRIRFRGDLVSEVRWFYDLMELGRQIGAAPPVGSLAERSSVLMQRMKARRLRKLTAA